MLVPLVGGTPERITDGFWIVGLMLVLLGPISLFVW